MFDGAGRAVAVTVLSVPTNRVVQVKTPERDGYAAVQLGVGQKKRPTKAEAGHAAAAGIPAPAVLREFRVADPSLRPGAEVNLSLFADVALVDVAGRSKGRGFAGVVKRHGFHRGPKTHGSKAYRRPKTSGPSTTPGEVRKRQPMPGRMGYRWVVTPNLKVMMVDVEKSLLVVKGATPGPNRGIVVIYPSRRQPKARRGT